MKQKNWITPRAPTRFFDSGHQRAAEPLHRLIIIIGGIVTIICIGGGIVAIIWGAVSKTDFEFLGAHLSTDHVGVAFVGIGLLTSFFTVRAVLKNQHKLAKLPPDESRERHRSDPRV